MNVVDFATNDPSPFQTIADNFTSDVRHIVAQVVQAWGLAGRGTRNGYNAGQEWGRIIGFLLTSDSTPALLQ